MQTVSATPTSPPFLPMSLSTAFMLLLAHMGLTATEGSAPTRPVPPGATALSRETPQQFLEYASSYLHAQKGPSSRASPHLQLAELFITALLPQADAPPSSRPIPARLGAEFLSIALDMWLTDADMPTPSQGAGTAVSSPAQLQRSTSLTVQQAGSYTSSSFVPPMLLRTRCIKVCVLPVSMNASRHWVGQLIAMIMKGVHNILCQRACNS